MFCVDIHCVASGKGSPPFTGTAGAVPPLSNATKFFFALRFLTKNGKNEAFNFRRERGRLCANQ
jgi:hypothetical protein